MHVLAFRHVPHEHPGGIAAALAARGIRCEMADLAAAPESWESADGLLFLGGPMSANDDLPFLRAELRIVERAATAGKPLLGVCLGAQLIARALGAKVYRNPVKEIGWAPIQWTPAARNDFLFGEFAEPETVFHWHGETFDLPAGAEWLSYSDLCRNQAFRAGSNIYGLQFHLEVTPEMIAEWLQVEENQGDLRELEAPVDPFLNAGRLKQMGDAVFGRWAELVAAGRK